MSTWKQWQIECLPKHWIHVINYETQLIKQVALNSSRGGLDINYIIVIIYLNLYKINLIFSRDIFVGLIKDKWWARTYQKKWYQHFLTSTYTIKTRLLFCLNFRKVWFLFSINVDSCYYWFMLVRGSSYLAQLKIAYFWVFFGKRYRHLQNY